MLKGLSCAGIVNMVSTPRWGHALLRVKCRLINKQLINYVFYELERYCWPDVMIKVRIPKNDKYPLTRSSANFSCFTFSGFEDVRQLIKRTNYGERVFGELHPSTFMSARVLAFPLFGHGYFDSTRVVILMDGYA
jgi:hypothetical protein